MPKCRVCKSTYTPTRALQPTCGAYHCLCTYADAIVAKSAAKREKADRDAIKVREEKAKTRRQWINEAQTAMNAWVRERDRDRPCISCGRHHEGQYHAGHYLSTGARPGLRFDIRNLHKQCQPCNTHLSGNLLNYRIGLIALIGLEAVEVLESDHTVKKWPIDDLRTIRDTYRADLKRLKALP